MPGVTKHIFNRELIDINKMLTKQLKTIANILPKNYNSNDIIYLIKKYYPHEWESIFIKYKYYEVKDKYIEKFKEKKRYNMPLPEDIIKNNRDFQLLLDKTKINKYNNQFSETKRKENEILLMQKRKPKIEKIDNKISLAISNTQQVNPKYLDKIIGLYERKNTIQSDKVYILNELKKYYTSEIINFFFKVNDKELNNQLRLIAFYHLQSFNYAPRLRKRKYMIIHTKNKKRKDYLKNEYPFLKFKIKGNPEELNNRILIGKEQKYNNYDYFICHSSLDGEMVRKLITRENRIGKDVFCDWLNDRDYLKRELLCNATKKVLEQRMKSSESILFIKSENSIKSLWCKYELNYFYRLRKPMYIISLNDIEKGNYNNIAKINDIKWFYDDNYNEYDLVNY